MITYKLERCLRFDGNDGQWITVATSSSLTWLKNVWVKWRKECPEMSYRIHKVETILTLIEFSEGD